MNKRSINLELARELLSPPGDTIQETIDTLGMSQNELAERMGRPVKTVNEIIKGKEALTPATAVQLERVLHIPAAFWLERERQYMQALTAIEHEAKLDSWANTWLVQFPVKVLEKLGWIPSHVSKTKTVEALLSFFGVATPDEWTSVYIGEKMNTSYYRISLAHVTQHLELAVVLFQKDKLTLGQAARLAGMPQYKFQALLSSRDIPIHYGVEEYQEDLQTIKSLNL